MILIAERLTKTERGSSVTRQRDSGVACLKSPHVYSCLLFELAVIRMKAEFETPPKRTTEIICTCH